MRWIAGTAAGVLLLAAFGLWPFHAHDPGELLPVQAMTVRRAGAGVAVQTDGGLQGCGASYAAAVRAMEETAPGRVFFGACSAVCVSGGENLLRAVAADTRLRGAVGCYRAQKAPPADQLALLSRAHPGGVTLAEVRTGSRSLPVVRETASGWWISHVS